jgi:hypothetical protein
MPRGITNRLSEGLVSYVYTDFHSRTLCRSGRCPHFNCAANGRSYIRMPHVLSCGIRNKLELCDEITSYADGERHHGQSIDCFIRQSPSSRQS